MSKITKATFKSFIRKNREHLLVSHPSSFDGTQDCVVEGDKTFHKAVDTDRFMENTAGIAGVWLVGGGHDYFTAYEKDGLKGIEVYNCCGRSIIAVKEHR